MIQIRVGKQKKKEKKKIYTENKIKKCFVSIWELSHREKLSGEKVFRIHGRAGAENGTESQGSGFAGSNRIKGESYRSLCKRRL